MVADAVPPSSSANRVHSVERTFELLEAVVELGGTARLGMLALRLGLPQTTTHRIARTLVDLGYLSQRPYREYSLGRRLSRLGEHVRQLSGGWAEPYLRELVDGTGESANLAVLDGDRIVYVAQVAGHHAMRGFTEVGTTAPAHCTAAGKAILAHLPPGEAIAGLPLPARTAHTITAADRMEQELRRIRRTGHAVDDEEHEIGLRCVAVAVPGRLPPSALSLSGPSPRMTDALIQRSVPLLHRVATRLSTLAG